MQRRRKGDVFCCCCLPIDVQMFTRLCVRRLCRQRVVLLLPKTSSCAFCFITSLYNDIKGLHCVVHVLVCAENMLRACA